MTAAFSRFKTHFANWREWELNPIVIKELRQGVRSWTVTGMLFFFLIVLFIAALVFLLTESFSLNANMELGASMFSAFVVILAGASVLFIPLYTGVRVAAERQENNVDLLYVSTLSPTRIILGKFLCSAYITLLFFSACMPFMAFTNLLRGVDLPTVFFILAFLFLVVCAANMIAIFLACLPMSRPFKFLFVIYGFFQCFGIMASLVSGSYMFMRSGIGAMMTERNFWIGAATAAGIGLVAVGLFFILSVALISPPSANRALPIRIYLTVVWLLGGLLCFSWVVHAGSATAELMNLWLFLTFGMAMVALLVVISNADQLSLRVQRTIPQSGLKRICAFLFFNGAAGGVIWVGGILAATFFGTRAIQLLFSSAASAANSSDETRIQFATTAAYAFAYALTALFVQRKFLARRPPKLAGLLAVLLAGAWAIMPSIALFFLNRLSWKSVEGLQLGNVFNVFFTRDSSQLVYHEYLAGGWLFIVVALNAKWFARQVKNFRPPASAPRGKTPPGVSQTLATENSPTPLPSIPKPPPVNQDPAPSSIRPPVLPSQAGGGSQLSPDHLAALMEQATSADHLAELMKQAMMERSMWGQAIERKFGDDITKLSPELFDELVDCITDKQTFNFVGARLGRPLEQDIAAFEQIIGFSLPKDFRSFTMTGFGCLSLEVNESIWPRPKAGAIVPAWYLTHSLYVYGLSSDVPDHMDLRKQFALFSKGGQQMVPFLRLEGLRSDFNHYCFTPTGGIVFCRQNARDAEPVDFTFTALLIKEIQTLRERAKKIQTEPNPYA